MAKTRKKLPVKCGASDCAHEEHCYRPKKVRNKPRAMPGACITCGVERVDWPVIHKRLARNIEATIAALRTEHVRKFFWNLTLGETTRKSSFKKGAVKLKVQVGKQLASAVGRGRHPREGRQTPMLEDDPNPINYAQHATATCCRRCMSYWHGIPEGRELDTGELEYAERLVSRYLEEKLPGLPEKGVNLERRHKDQFVLF